MPYRNPAGQGVSGSLCLCPSPGDSRSTQSWHSAASPRHSQPWYSTGRSWKLLALRDWHGREVFPYQVANFSILESYSTRCFIDPTAAGGCGLFSQQSCRGSHESRNSDSQCSCSWGIPGFRHRASQHLNTSGSARDGVQVLGAHSSTPRVV